MSEAAKTRRARRRRAGWLAAVSFSAFVHAGVLLVVALYGRSPGDDAAAEAAVEARRKGPELVVLTVPVEVASLDLADLPPVDVPPAIARPLDAPPGERDNPAAVTRAPADADGRDRRPPAPDRGAKGGAPPAHAFRLDSSTLRSRLTDGALEDQSAELRTSRRRASPQAIRREPKVGIGDSVRSAVPSRAPISPPATAAQPALGGEPAGAALTPSPAAPSEGAPLVARVDPHPDTAHGVGPLDAEAGKRSFDVQRPGAAADDRTQRTASDELHPGITDFSRASAPGAVPLTQGRGPGATPGAVARPSAGNAPAELGAPNPREMGAAVEERTLDRRYQRYVEEIRQRVRRIREFPRSLAVRLLEGETIVAFVVDVNGRLGDGPRVTKSSGFEEFDAAAVRAVRRAAPFPPMPDPGSARPLSVSLRVIFDNPVVR